MGVPLGETLQTEASRVLDARRVSWRVLLSVAVVVLAFLPTGLGQLIRGVLVDAFTAVGSFVGFTLLLLYGMERRVGVDLGTMLARARRLQVPFAALLGAMPGCGGAVVVVSAYAARRVSFGGVVAALTATMGDAAFVLIARRPEMAAVVLPLALLVGILWGWTLDGLGVRRTAGARVAEILDQADEPVSVLENRWVHRVYLVLLACGLCLGVGALFGLELPSVLVLPVGCVGSFVGLWIWSASPVQAMTHSASPPLARMSEETAFITAWVLGAFLGYELLVSYAGLDLEVLFTAGGVWIPLLAIVVGFIPGCGPQILVTTLYLSGLIPFSALIGNAIANDGDALFPAIALEPRAAVWATVYSALPAVVVAYFFWTLLPDF